MMVARVDANGKVVSGPKYANNMNSSLVCENAALDFWNDLFPSVEKD